jgi:hypothetical protein
VKFDTDRLRRKTIAGLEQLFDIANDYARGRVKWQTRDGRVEKVTIKQRQMWARIAAYIAQIMNTIAQGIDERQLDQDLDKLEKLVNEAGAAGKAKESSQSEGKQATT